MRPEYRALVDGLPDLLRDFGCTLDASARADVEILMTAVERIDRELDAIGDADERRRYSASVIAQLSGAREGLAELHALIVRRRIEAAFTQRTGELLAISERVRTSIEARDYIGLVEQEGRLMIELVLLFVEPYTNERFVRFFRSLAELANLLDKLVDARGDFRRGELALHPGLALHARLAGRLLQRFPAALAHHPRRLHFLAWGLAWIPRAIRAAELAA